MDRPPDAQAALRRVASKLREASRAWAEGLAGLADTLEALSVYEPPPPPIPQIIQVAPPIPDKPKRARDGELTQREVCELLNISHDTLWRWKNTPKLHFPKPVRSGSRPRWTREAINAWRAARPRA